MKFYRKIIKTASGKKEHGRDRSCDTDFQQHFNALEKNIFPTIEENLSYIRNTTGDAIGLVENRYNILGGKVKAGLAYIEMMADKDLISQHLLVPLMKDIAEFNKHPVEILSIIQTSIIPASKTYITGEMQQVIGALLNGDTAFFLDNSEIALVIGSRKLKKRAIEKPENESTVLGSQESFTDNIDTNISLVIKRLPVKELHFESFTAGQLSKTMTKLIWLDGIANTKIIEDVKKRIQSVDIDIVDGLGALAELIEDSPRSIFPKYRQAKTLRPPLSRITLRRTARIIPVRRNRVRGCRRR
jgi:spore germination protein KA